MTKQLNSLSTAEEKAEFLLEQSKILDVSTEKNKSIFYAGRTQHIDAETGELVTVTARETAEKYADNLFTDKGITKLTLERTPGSQWMDDLKLFEKLPDGTYTYETYGLTLEQTNEIWSNLSSRYAEGASGAVTAFSKNVPDIWKSKTVFWSTELSVLRNNPDVTHINIR